jgi:hypothetical protein
MNTRPLVLGLFLAIGLTTGALAQMPPPPPGGPGGPGGPGHEPPPQAYEDCKGKKEGDAIQHQTPQGLVPAKCLNSPKGLVARPDRPPPGMPGPDQMSPPK